jgi:hypothetical protein
MHSDLDPNEHTPGETPSQDITQRLRDLPTDLRPPFDYEEFQRRVRERAAPRYAVKWQHAAAAGGIFTLLAAFAVWSRFLQPENELAVPSASTLVAEDSLPLVVAVDPMSAARARAAEHWLSNLPREPAIVRGETRLAVTDLEERIAWVDDALTDERFEGVDLSQLAALQHERVRLINSLAQVRYAETLASQLP